MWPVLLEVYAFLHVMVQCYEKTPEARFEWVSSNTRTSMVFQQGSYTCWESEYIILNWSAVPNAATPLPVHWLAHSLCGKQVCLHVHVMPWYAELGPNKQIRSHLKIPANNYTNKGCHGRRKIKEKRRENKEAAVFCNNSRCFLFLLEGDFLLAYTEFLKWWHCSLKMEL